MEGEGGFSACQERRAARCDVTTREQNDTMVLVCHGRATWLWGLGKGAVLNAVDSRRPRPGDGVIRAASSLGDLYPAYF
jgi:hypothetical protein